MEIIKFWKHIDTLAKLPWEIDNWSPSCYLHNQTQLTRLVDYEWDFLNIQFSSHTLVSLGIKTDPANQIVDRAFTLPRRIPMHCNEIHAATVAILSNQNIVQTPILIENTPWRNRPAKGKKYCQRWQRDCLVSCLRMRRNQRNKLYLFQDYSYK
jgi:hypothetical protein